MNQKGEPDLNLAWLTIAVLVAAEAVELLANTFGLACKMSPWISPIIKFF